MFFCLFCFVVFVLLLSVDHFVVVSIVFKCSCGGFSNQLLQLSSSCCYLFGPSLGFF